MMQLQVQNAMLSSPRKKNPSNCNLHILEIFTSFLLFYWGQITSTILSNPSWLLSQSNGPVRLGLTWNSARSKTRGVVRNPSLEDSRQNPSLELYIAAIVSSLPTVDDSNVAWTPESFIQLILGIRFYVWEIEGELSLWWRENCARGSLLWACRWWRTYPLRSSELNIFYSACQF